ncbi:MAG: hypothetical protein CMO80_17340 [Verrucomicrobiales bacterium]|nr:hypothetical protein [Verrucomicrobiales bacterium]
MRALAEDEEDAFEAFMEEQLLADKIDDPAAFNAVRKFETLTLPTGELFEYQEKLLLRELSQATFLRAVYSERQLFVMSGQIISQFKDGKFSAGIRDGAIALDKMARGLPLPAVKASKKQRAMNWFIGVLVVLHLYSFGRHGRRGWAWDIWSWIFSLPGANLRSITEASNRSGGQYAYTGIWQTGTSNSHLSGGFFGSGGFSSGGSFGGGSRPPGVFATATRTIPYPQDD